MAPGLVYSTLDSRPGTALSALGRFYARWAFGLPMADKFVKFYDKYDRAPQPLSESSPQTDRVDRVPSWEFRNRRKPFTPRSWQRIPWDFAYLCWANPFILNFGHLRRLTLLTGLCAAVLAGVLPIDVLSSMVSIGTLLALHDCLLERRRSSENQA